MPVPNATHFYKYRAYDRPERLEQIILAHELYFPTAQQLNDPAECQPRITFSSRRDKVRFLMRTWRRAHPGANLMDISSEFARADEGLAQMGEQRFHQELVRAFYEISTQTRIFSMSRRWDHMAQWAKYANDHTGYCLEFANAGVFANAQEVQYGGAFELDITSPEAAQDAHPLFFRKTSDWSNEEEVRLVGPTIAHPILYFDPALLTRIILGKDIKPKHEERIRGWATARNPPLVVVRATYNAIQQALRLE